MDGWVGGSCARPIVVREALDALASGKPRLVRLRGRGATSAESQGEEGLAEYPMTCHSGGTLEIFVEPFHPAPHLVVVGTSPVARALATLAAFLGYEVTAVAPDATEADFPAARRVLQRVEELEALLTPESRLVVASVGEYDEDALALAVPTAPNYLAVVASPRRAAALREYLLSRGLDHDAVARLKAPAGLDLGAVEPEEIALSIMAEIVKARRSVGQPPLSALAARPEPAPVATAIDPICGMTVEIEGARFTAEVDGTKVYFCCPSCRRRYLDERVTVEGGR
jgi:xanthine dehydrogenase accessory factor